MSATTTTTAPLSLTAVRSDPAAFRIRGAPRGDGPQGSTILRQAAREH